MLPDDLRNLLRETNGVRTWHSRILRSAEEILEENLRSRNNDVLAEIYMPFDSLLFFADAGNGDQFAYAIKRAGAIRRTDRFVWDHEDDSRRCIAPSLATFIEGWMTGRISI